MPRVYEFSTVKETDCWTCGETFTYRASKNGRDRTYCSRPCFYEGARRAKGGRVTDGKPLPRVYLKTRPCDVCSAPFDVKAHNQRWCSTCCPDKAARARLQRYGISHPQWLEMVARYDGQCWICREKPAVALDHDHTTGAPRGALCDGCNVMLAALELDEWREKATRYLREVS